MGSFTPKIGLETSKYIILNCGTKNKQDALTEAVCLFDLSYMKFGLRNTSFVYPGGTGDIWVDTKTHIQRAERDGFHSFWVMDHFFQLPSHGPEEEPFLDAWTVLPALAAVTSRIRIGAMVSPVGYRNPALLARMAASLDHILPS